MRSAYWKSIIATLTAIAVTVVQAIQASQADGEWSNEDTIVTVLAFLGAVLVYAKANDSANADYSRHTPISE